KIDIEPTARIADDHNRLGRDGATAQRPQIFAIIKSRAVTDRAAVQFPRRGRGKDDDGDDDRDPTPRHRRNRTLEFKPRGAVALFGTRWFPEKQARKAQSLLKIGNK